MDALLGIKNTSAELREAVKAFEATLFDDSGVLNLYGQHWVCPSMLTLAIGHQPFDLQYIDGLPW